MMSNKPYLVRAFYDWIVDNKCTPYLVVNAAYPRTQVPREFVENDQITLDVSPHAIRDLKIGNEILTFQASFSSIVHVISVPIKAVLGIFAHENGQGMFFDFEDEEDGGETFDNLSSATEPSQNASSEGQSDKKPRPPHLKLVE